MSVTNPNAYYVLQGMGSPTLQSLFGSRMFFNLKDASEPETMVSTLELPMPIGAGPMRFAQKAEETQGETTASSSLHA